MSPAGLCARMAEAAKTGEWKAGNGSIGRMDQGG
jgi:hypothetical protein